MQKRSVIIVGGICMLFLVVVMALLWLFPDGEIETSEPAKVEKSFPTFDLTKLSGSKQGWGPGIHTDEQNRPLSAMEFQQKYGQYNAAFIKNSQNITLTFDCGYENGQTNDILDTLKNKNVPAVFFITYDFALEEPELVKRMIADGHTVANHTMKHPSFPEVDAARATREVTELHKYVLDNFGTEMTLFRFPRGEFSEVMLALVSNLGYRSVFWSFAYVDWYVDDQPETAASLEKLTSALHPGAIYLLHNVSETNAAILGDFIDNAREKGYVFDTVL